MNPVNISFTKAQLIDLIKQLSMQTKQELLSLLLSEIQKGLSEDVVNDLPDIQLEKYNTPINLEEYALSLEELSKLQVLFEDAPTAEELIKKMEK